MHDLLHERPCIGVGVLLWRGEKLLLGKRKLAQGDFCWQFPGGHLEYKEHVLDCAAREVKEETGLTIEHAKEAGYTGQVCLIDRRHYITLYVSAQCMHGEPELREPEKCSGWQWCNAVALPAPLFAPINSLLHAYPDLTQLR